MIKTATGFWLLLSAVLAVTAAPPTPPTHLRFTNSAAGTVYLTVSGTNLVYKGQVVVLRGENFNNGPALSCCGGPDINLINANAADYAQARNALGVNLIRFGMDHQWYTANRANFFTVVDRHVAWARTNHLWMIPVIFIAPGDPGGNAFGNQSGFWNSTSNQQLLISFWSDFAAHYANEPTIAGYDLYNEPGPPSLATYTSWCQSAYNAITAVDTNHFVVIECSSADGNGSLPNVSGTRILWSSHCYNPVGGGCTFAGTSSGSPSKRPFWIGEMGATGSPGAATSYVSANLANYNQQGISWAHFVMHWSAGGYGLYQSWTAGDFATPWTQMIQVVKNATAGSVYPQ